MKDLTELRKIAEAATPGPWVYGDNRDGLGNKLHPAKFPGKYNPIADFECTEDEDAEHIATFDPPTVLALLSRLEQAEQAVSLIRAMAQDWDANGNACGLGDPTADVWHATANAIRVELDRMARTNQGENNEGLQ